MKHQMLSKGKGWMKTLLLSGCITAFSASAAFAMPAQELGSMEPVLQAPYSEEVAHMQAEIDQFLFEEHASALVEQGIHVTHTSPNGEVVEIGIADYREGVASYLIEQLADYDVEIVEGEQAYTLAHPVANTLPADADSEGSLQMELEERTDVQQMQAEIDQFLFEEHASALQEQGIQVTHTGPEADYVEIGIVDYNEEAANYLTDQLSEYDVVIVEGEQAHTLSDGEAEVVTTISAEVDSASEAVDAAGAADNSKAATTIVALAVAALLVFIVFAAYRGKSRQD